jgi:hypothetical protein
MTAIGVALLLIVALLLFLDNGRYPKWLETIGGGCAMAGFALTCLGVVTWLWQVMP